jgi:Glutaminase
MANVSETALLTVAAIRAGKGNKPTKFLFNEQQAIFTFGERAKAADDALGLLRGALKSGEPVKVAFDTRRGAIQRVAAPSAREFEEFKRGRILLEKPQKVVPIAVEKIDPTTFNFVDLYLKWPIFRLCLTTIPNYAKAKEIFDFCANLSCHLPGPYVVTPCIPFQYVRDGCYARAHQMRRIITERYRYCCEKVFSFGYVGNDELSVVAGKWGGCCVNWWYHVAPLVRVRMRLIGLTKKPLTLTLAMVIDPSMFDKPVLLSTWLAAQENPACSATANVSSYSIQPGSAYTPAGGPTSFTTDDDYSKTEAKLIAYSGLTTC